MSHPNGAPGRTGGSGSVRRFNQQSSKKGRSFIMSNLNPTQGTVRRTLLRGKKVPDGLSTLENVCSVGAQCPEVQNSPVAVQALGVLKQSVATAQGAVIKKQGTAQAHLAATGAVKLA